MKKLGLTLAFLIMASSAWADGYFYCGNRVVTIGEDAMSVEMKCGPPFRRGTTPGEVIEECQGNNCVRRIVQYERWLYPTSYDYYRVLIFKQNILIDIRP